MPTTDTCTGESAAARLPGPKVQTVQAVQTTEEQISKRATCRQGNTIQQQKTALMGPRRQKAAASTTTAAAAADP